MTAALPSRHSWSMECADPPSTLSGSASAAWPSSASSRIAPCGMPSGSASGGAGTPPPPIIDAPPKMPPAMAPAGMPAGMPAVPTAPPDAFALWTYLRRGLTKGCVFQYFLPLAPFWSRCVGRSATRCHSILEISLRASGVILVVSSLSSPLRMYMREVCPASVTSRKTSGSIRCLTLSPVSSMTSLPAQSAGFSSLLTLPRGKPHDEPLAQPLTMSALCQSRESTTPP
mmetsp:Transcript_194/g.517  ORF Transcript_194/g.517 Transcript_194/m.517 type:complete len:229 (+) Transcript_194:3-689(+)